MPSAARATLEPGPPQCAAGIFLPITNFRGTLSVFGHQPSSIRLPCTAIQRHLWSQFRTFSLGAEMPLTLLVGRPGLVISLAQSFNASWCTTLH